MHPISLTSRDAAANRVVTEFLPSSRLHGFSSALLQGLIDASASNIAILDESRKILYVNRAWRQFARGTGLLDGEHGVGKKYPDLCVGVATSSQEHSTAIANGLQRIIDGGEIEFETEYRCHAVAEPLWFRVHAAGFRFPATGGSLWLLVTHDDISREKLASEALRKDEERLRRLLATTNVIPWEADAETWLFTYVGEQAVEMLGYSCEQWFEPDFWTEHIHPEDRERAIAECLRLSEESDNYQFEYRVITKDGRTVWIHDLVNVLRENARPVRIRGFMIDITERKLTEDTLRDLSGRLITAQEEERKRIARELHDDLNQQMALVSIELEQIGQMLPNKRDGLAERLKELQKKALGISTDIHRISYKLHPSKLDHLGLAPALKSFCSELSESRGVNIEFRHKGFPATLPNNTTLCVFRIAQEALQNAIKHSGASKINIFLTKTDKTVELVVSDTGCGFDMNNDLMAKGLGFISMRERLRLVDGTISVASKPSKGTKVNISVPVNNAGTELPGLPAGD